MKHRLRHSRRADEAHFVRGQALWRALGYANERAFERARVRGAITVPLYPIPGQSRGLFARRDDLERWKAAQAQDTLREGDDMA